LIFKKINYLVIAFGKAFRFVSAPANPNNLLLVLDLIRGLSRACSLFWYTMALYYRYKSERFFDSIAINVPFISVRYFKQRIFESKRYGWGNDFDLVVINAHNNEGLS
jgi:hypothetical protein